MQLSELWQHGKNETGSLYKSVEKVARKYTVSVRKLCRYYKDLKKVSRGVT